VPKVSQAEAAKMVGVSERLVRDAVKVVENIRVHHGEQTPVPATERQASRRASGLTYAIYMIVSAKVVENIRGHHGGQTRVPSTERLASRRESARTWRTFRGRFGNHGSQKAAAAGRVVSRWPVWEPRFPESRRCRQGNVLWPVCVQLYTNCRRRCRLTGGRLATANMATD
jgi:hypothetical protein